MAKSKKTKKVEEVIDNTQLEPIGEIRLEQKKLENCEWCFQFDDDEPQVFAWTGDDENNDEDPKVIFTITNMENSYITFTHKNGKNFKLFARELSDEGRRMREYQNKLNEELKKDLENESTNKEA